MANYSGYCTNMTIDSMVRPNFPLFFRGLLGEWEANINLKIVRVPHPHTRNPLVSYNRPTDHMPFLRGDSDPKSTYSNQQGSMLMDYYAVPDLYHFYFTPIRQNLPFPYNLSLDTAKQVPGPYPISKEEFAGLPQPFHFISKQSELDAYMAAVKKFKYGLSVTQREDLLASGSEPPTRQGNASFSGHQSTSNPSPVLNPPNVSSQRPISVNPSPISSVRDSTQNTSSSILGTTSNANPSNSSTSTSPSTKIVFPRPAPFLASCAELPPTYINDFCAYRVSLAFTIKEYNPSSSELISVSTAELERHLAESSATKHARSVSSVGIPEKLHHCPLRDEGTILSNETPKNVHEYPSRHSDNTSIDGKPINLKDCSDPLPLLHVQMIQYFLDKFMLSGYFKTLMCEMVLTVQQLQYLDKFAPETTITKTEIPNTVTHDCCICLSGLKIGDLSRTLPCRHHMHRDCIDAWFQENNRCPMCRTQVIPDE